MTRTSRLTDARGIGPGLVVALLVVVVLDQVLALGTIGQNPAGTLSRGELPLGPRLLAGIVGALALSGFLLLARATWLRTGLARRRPSVMVATVLTGTALGLRTGRQALSARRTDPTVLQVAFDDTLLVSVLTLALIIVFGLLGHHHDATVTLRAATMRWQAALAAGEQALREEREQLRAQVRTLLEARLGPAAVDGPAFTAVRLRTIADEVLRPLSHRLDDVRTGFEPTPPVHVDDLPSWRALRDLRPEPIVRPRLLTTAMVLLTFRLSTTFVAPSEEPTWPALPQSGVTVTVDWSSLTSSLLLHATTLVGVLVGTRLLARRLHATEAPATLAGRWTFAILGQILLGLTIFAAIRVAHLLPLFGSLSPITVAMLLGFTAPLVLVTVAVSTFEASEHALAAATAARERTNHELAQAVARTNALLTHERRTFARHLHASVQAAVNAGSLLLERAEASGALDATLIARVAQRIERAVAGLEAGEEPAGTDLGARLVEITTAFEDLAQVTFEVDGSTAARLDADVTARATVGDVILEACANAVLHGRASRVHVRLGTSDDDAIDLTVQDDGASSAVHTATGLGTRVLETSCTSWRLDHREDGSTLTATLPVR